MTAETNPQTDATASAEPSATPATAASAATSATAATLTPDTALIEALGKRDAQAIQKAFGFNTVADMLAHIPRRYLDVGELTAVRDLPLGEDVTVAARVIHAHQRRMHRRKGFLLEIEVESEQDGGLMPMTFFNGYLAAQQLTPGTRAVFSGKVTAYKGALQLSHPEYTLLGEDQEAEAKPFPIYPLKGKIGQIRMRTLQAKLLERIDPETFTDPIPTPLRTHHRLPDRVSALRAIHQPENLQAAYRARQRFVFQEALVLQTFLADRKAALAGQTAVPRPKRTGGLLEAFDAALPFMLTPGQVEVGEQIASDLARSHPMNRLVQGDVGSGKTLVALRAMLQVVDAGGQAAFMAPTEVLAQQHAATLRSMLGELARAGELGAPETATRVELLTGSLKTAQKRETLLAAASGQAGIVVGTHALISDHVQFAELGLVVVDEQHRFGVEQRDKLRDGAGATPHMLVMTATPIPRTIAMTVFGDVDVSTLKGLPAGRAEVKTFVVPLALPAWKERIFTLIRDEVAQGHQAYVVVPRITASEDQYHNEPADSPGQPGSAGQPSSAAATVAPEEGMLPLEVQAQENHTQRTPLETMYEVLAGHPALKDVRIGVLHGGMDPADKAQAMDDFENHRSDVLLATTVIEVGVDVPNATVMAIIDADAFGISQLHQLRGRIGRGNLPGTCLLVTNLEHQHPSVERLETVASTTDGFALAEEDVKLRREGDILGQSQSGGKSTLNLLRVMRDAGVIQAAREDAHGIVAPGWRAAHPELARLVAELEDSESAAYLQRS